MEFPSFQLPYWCKCLRETEQTIADTCGKYSLSTKHSHSQQRKKYINFWYYCFYLCRNNTKHEPTLLTSNYVVLTRQCNTGTCFHDTQTVQHDCLPHKWIMTHILCLNFIIIWTITFEKDIVGVLIWKSQCNCLSAYLPLLSIFENSRSYLAAHYKPDTRRERRKKCGLVWLP